MTAILDASEEGLQLLGAGGGLTDPPTKQGGPHRAWCGAHLEDGVLDGAFLYAALRLLEALRLQPRDV
jgi:hypothetical protein